MSPQIPTTPNSVARQTLPPDEPRPASNGSATLRLELAVHDPETVAELEAFAAGRDREDFALKALRIGVLALRQARGQLDGETVRREGDRLLGLLQVRLEDHTKVVHDRVSHTLKDYFDPQSGRFQDRVERLVKKDGELEQVLRRQLGQDDSELSRTLSRHFGDDSELLKWLNPDQSQGLLGALRGVLDEQLLSQRDHVLKQFSLDNKEGALFRFIAELTERQGNLTEDLQTRIDEVVKQFSLDEENSALSRLVANVERAQRTITNEFSLDQDTSALSRLKKMLENTNATIESHLSLDEETSALARLKRELLALMEGQRKTNQVFQEEIKLSLQEMIVRKKEAGKSTRHGLEFEEEVIQLLVLESQKTGDLAEATGSSTGRIKNCKVGDAVITLGPDTVAPGGRIVMEAKEKAGYQLTEAVEELAKARDNRDAQVGLFVFSRRTAPAGLEPLFRRGMDVFVIWDLDDESSDLYLRTGLTLARALVVQQQKQNEAQTADVVAMEIAILDIEKQINSLDEMIGWTKTIEGHSGKILNKLDSVRKAIEKQVATLKEKTAELKGA
ncbi:hypothetical protein [Planctellipticum variicoloris]|uniref:hypothetical protein n=1 Tax=Planctellipticum variicoloris TaxID=3064265 RepID=UPI00301338EB|nr:hypothetical protein SH412_001234 [Planctomycetaceae bacterium SH412]